MITHESAEKLARELIQPFIDGGVATESMIELVTRLIVQHVEIDELQQQIRARTS